MYCPKCTLEIKGEDQGTCPICSETLIESPVEKTEEPTAEDLKLQELIADIDLSVSGSDDPLLSQETMDSEDAELSVTDPDFKLEMDDNLLEPAPEPDVSSLTLAGEDTGSAPEAAQSGDELSVDLEKEFLLDDEMTDGEFSSDQVEDNFFDLEEELGLVDKKMKEVEEETPKIDFDKFALNEEEKNFALDDAGEDEDEDEESVAVAEPDSKEELEKTLEELDPIKDIRQSQKKSSSFGLIAVFLILVVVCVIAYTKFKSEIESFIKTDAAKIAKDEKLKDKFGPKAVKPVEKVVVKEDLVEEKDPVEEVAEKPVEAAVEKPLDKSVDKPAAENLDKIVEVMKVVAPPKTVKEEVVVPVMPSLTYSIHAGSFRKTELAQKDLDRFSKMGLNAYIERVNLGEKGVWYRVKIGLYNTRVEAVSAEKELLEKVKVQTRIIRNK